MPTTPDAVTTAFNDPDLTSRCYSATTPDLAAALAYGLFTGLNTAGCVAAYRHAVQAQPRLDHLATAILLAANSMSLLVSVEDLLREDHPDDREGIVRSLLDNLRRDDPISLGLAGALGSLLASDWGALDPALQAALQKPRPMTGAARARLREHGSPLAEEVALLSQLDEENQPGVDLRPLDGAQLDRAATTENQTLAYQLLNRADLRAQLSPAQVARLLNRVAPFALEALSQRLLYDENVTSWPTRTLALLLEVAPDFDFAKWLTGKLPAPPDPALLADIAPNSVRPREIFQSGIFRSERVADNVVCEHGGEFSTDSLYRHGVRALLDAAPLAVVDRALHERELGNPFWEHLHDRVTATLPDTDDVWRLVGQVANEVQPDTVADLVDIVTTLRVDTPGTVASAPALNRA